MSTSKKHLDDYPATKKILNCPNADSRHGESVSTTGFVTERTQSAQKAFAGRQLNSARDRGFNLVELLVVIAIISIVASLLLPVLVRAKAASRRVQCMNNLHQEGVFTFIYASDNGDKIPNGTNMYIGILHLLYPNEQTSPPILADPNRICPSDSVSARSLNRLFEPSTQSGLCNQSYTDYSSYAFNGGGPESTNNGVAGVPLSSVVEPGRTVFWIEIAGTAAFSNHQPKPGVQYPDAKNTIGFVDGGLQYLPIYWDGRRGRLNQPYQYNPPGGALYQYKWTAGGN